MPEPRDTGPASRRGMHLDVLTLAFSGPNAALEAPFREEYFRRSLPQLRVTLVLGALLYAAFAVLDHLMMPDRQQVAWFIRFAVVAPAILLVQVYSFRPGFRRAMQPLLAALNVAGGAGIVAMIVVGPPLVGHNYYAGLILVLIFTYTLVRMRFLWATAAGWIMVLLYEGAAPTLAGIHGPVLLANSFFLVAANLAGMATCYAMEFAARRDFYLAHLLTRERERVSEANRLLESKVEERTAELRREIAERQRVAEERERLQLQLKGAEKMETIGRLAAGVAHDLNNILSGLVTYPEFLMLDLPAESRLREPLTLIRNSGLKAAAIVHDLLALSRRGLPEARICSLNACIRDYLGSPEFGQLRAAHPAHDLQVDLQEDALNLRGSPVHLAKIAMNLIGNAFEANLVAGSVRVSTRNAYIDAPRPGFETIPEGEYVVLSIADTGIGIAAADLKRVFEPFFSKKKAGRSGTGLGMTLVWSALKDHGGFIDVNSAEGRGTTFDLFFPAVREAEAGEPPPLAIEDCRGSERVLVVDDVAEQRDIAAAMLRKLGYDVRVAASGEEAVALLRAQPADVLVLDMVMEPGIDGCETYRRIVAGHPGQRAVIASGFSESERVREAQRLGAGAYLRKPYSLERIARAVRAELVRPLGSGG